MSELLFWFFLLFILYTYFGYPVFIWLLSQLRAPELVEIQGVSEWPEITVIIPVFNEINNIEKKINNLNSLNYPLEKITIMFVSDGSSDGSNELLANYSTIKLISYEKRKGKPTALNTAIKKSTSDIVVFTDVRQVIDKDALKFLVKRLSEPGIGAVSAELCHVEASTNIGKNVGLYWRYEKWIRKSESRFYSTAGVTGALYAIYRKDYHSLREDTLLDDFEIPMNIVKKGKKVVLESQAKLFDVSQSDIAAEKKRKIRTLTGNYQSFIRNVWLFTPWKNPICFQFLSHKVFRLLVPYAMIITLITAYLNDELIYTFFFYGQLLFYCVAAVGMLSKKIRSYKLVSIIVVFTELNLSAVVALKNYCFGRVKVRWDKV